MRKLFRKFLATTFSVGLALTLASCASMLGGGEKAPTPAGYYAELSATYTAALTTATELAKSDLLTKEQVLAIETVRKPIGAALDLAHFYIKRSDRDRAGGAKDAAKESDQLAYDALHKARFGGADGHGLEWLQETLRDVTMKGQLP